jgi:hypothetical protein
MSVDFRGEGGRSLLLAENLARPQTVAVSRRESLHGWIDIAFPPVERSLHDDLLRFHCHVFSKRPTTHIRGEHVSACTEQMKPGQRRL